jgi:hypothetical protein
MQISGMQPLDRRRQIRSVQALDALGRFMPRSDPGGLCAINSRFTYK